MTPASHATAVLASFRPASKAGRFFFLNEVAVTIHSIDVARIADQFCIKSTAKKSSIGTNSWQAAGTKRFENPTNFARFLMDEVPQVERDDVAIWLDTDIV